MRIVPIALTLLAASGILFAQAPSAIVKKTTTAPVIDGVIDAIWDSANTYNIDKQYRTATPTLGDAGTTTWKALWNFDGIYILLQINDDVFSPAYLGTSPTTDYAYDRPEIFFDVNAELKDGIGAQSSSGHIQIAPNFVEGQLDGIPVTNADGVINAFLVANPTYVAEYFIPFEKLIDKNGFLVNRSAVIGFDVTISDNDVAEPSRNTAVWANIGDKNESWFNMDDCGTITLEGAEVINILINEVSVSAAGGKTTIENDGESLQMIAAILPIDATYQTIQWDVINITGFATISKDGILTAVSNGIVKIIARSEDGSYLSAYKEISISNQSISMDVVNCILDGNFNTDGELPDPWVFLSYNGGVAPVIVNGIANCAAVAGDNTWEYMLSQSGLTAFPNVDYVFSFVAYADADRIINVDFEDTQQNNYNRYGTSTDPESNGTSDWTFGITTVPTTYTFNVIFDKMVESTVQKLVFQIAQTSDVVYLDNISLIKANDVALVSRLNFDLGTNKIVVCGDSIKINPDVYYNGPGELTYSWSPSEGLNATNIPNPVIFTKTNKKYTLTIASDLGNVKGSLTITVKPLTVFCGADKTIICGGQVQLSNPITNYSGTGALSYSWLPSDGLSSANIAQPTAEITTNTSYTLEINTPNGCKANDAVMIYVVPLTVNTGADKTLDCGKIQLSNPISNYSGSGSLSYSWFPANGLDSTNIAQPTAEVSTNTSYALEITTPNGCKANDTVMIIANPLITAVNDVNISCGNTEQLNVTTNYTGLGNLTYNWIPTTGLSASNIADPDVSLMSEATYYVEVSTPNGCIAFDSAVVVVSAMAYLPSICMVTVDENDRNVIVIKKEQSTIVEGYSIYRESLTQKDQYDLIGQVPYSETAFFVDMTSNAKVQSNKYRIAVKDICGFVTDKSSGHKTMHLTINKGVSTSWNLIWEPYIGAPVSGFVIYRGTTKSNLIQIANASGSNTTYTDLTAPEADVYYQIEAILQEPCISLKSTEHSSVRSNIISNSDATNGIFDNSLTKEFIYPNPAFDKLYFRTGYSANAVIRIYNLQGKQVLNRQIAEQIDISGLSKGVYIVKLIESGKVFVDKLVKE